MSPDRSHARRPLKSLGTSTTDKGRPPILKPSSPTSSGKKRISHACDRCRLMRTKCSGGSRCARCIKDDAQCVYGDHKREKNKRDLEETNGRVKELETKNRSLVATLQQLMNAPNFTDSERANMAGVLAKFSEEDQAESYDDSRSQPYDNKSLPAASETQAESGGEMSVPSTIGSPGRQGELRELVDIGRGAGAAGFIGKLSEMSWMQRCREYLRDWTESNSRSDDKYTFNERAIITVEVTYFMDDLDLLSVDEDHIDPLQWPPFQATVILSEAFFHATQGAFEFLSRDSFLETLYSFSQGPFMPTWAQRRWLAVANLVWAIGAKWLHLAELDGPELADNHLIYYARARALGLDHRVSFDHPDVGTMQGISLLAFYLLINGSISRAWNIIGNAIQHAITLGLHLRVSDPSVDSTERYMRSRMWFSLYKLQVLIAEITGRPQIIQSSHVTVELDISKPSVGDQDSGDHVVSVLQPPAEANRTWLEFIKPRLAESSPFVDFDVLHESFIHHTRLSQLSEEAADQLFTPGHEIAGVSWQDTQVKIKNLQASLEAWNGTLPEALKIDSGLQRRPHSRVAIQLATYACSISMMIHRPCLCEIVIDNESEESRSFNMSSAQACVRSAISMLDILPNELRHSIMCRLLPWWALLHYLCQAISVLLIELCLRAQHFQGEVIQIVHGIRKGMILLACLTERSLSAYKAWRIFQELLRRTNVLYRNPDMFDMNLRVIRPLGWSLSDEEDLLAALND